MKNQKGITLVTLIITIVLMLILLGVVVSVSIDGGLFSRAKQAKRETEKAAWDAKINEDIIIMNKKIEASDKYELAYNDEALLQAFSILLTDIQEKFELDNKYVLQVPDEDYSILNYEQLYIEGYIDDTFNPIKVPCKYDGREIVLIYEVDINEEAETVKIAKVSVEVSKFNIFARSEPVKVEVGGNVTSVTADGVPIPKGFYYVTGTKDTGVVISDDPGDENNINGNNGNQYVWVPVATNSKLNIELQPDNTTIQEVRILNTKGYDETITVNSDYFQKTINVKNNDVYEIIIKYADGTTEDILKEINSVYEVNCDVYQTIKIYSYLSGMSIDQTIEEFKSSLLESDPTLNFDTKISVLKYLKENLTANIYKDNASEKNNVLKYGGFYIGRYEGSLYGVKKSKTPLNNITYENAKTTIGSLYTDSAKYGVTAGLPSGAAWDAIGNWLVETDSKTEYQIYGDSTSWGNFRKVINNKDYSLKVTGNESKYAANNIYDLVGNVAEWTKEVEVEINSDTGEEEVLGNVARGDNYNGLTYSTFSSRDTSLEATDKIGGRPMLYIND